ncbi:MAG: nuclear transport factor 2 family protein [Bacteroidota bacterium]
MRAPRNYFVLIILLTGVLCQAQPTSESEVMAVVQSIFTGMASNNGEMVRQAFTTDAKMYTIVVDDAGKVQKREGSLEQFIQRVSQEKEQPYSEPIWNEKVQIDRQLASVWVDYAFYIGNSFHHCGVDAFHLMKTEGGWQVFHIVDTRRTEGCTVPEKVQALYR